MLMDSSDWEARAKQLGQDGMLWRNGNGGLGLDVKREDFGKQIDWEGENGFFEDKSVSIKLHYVKIEGTGEWYLDREKENFEAFCRGLSRNRSIEELHLDGPVPSNVEMFSIIAPFFEHNRNFRALAICCRGYGGLNYKNSQQLVLALERCTSLSEVTIEGMDRQNNMGSIIVGLSAIPNLRTVSFEAERSGWKGCMELGTLIQNSSSLQDLDLSMNEINDQVLSALSSALMGGNSTLKILDLGHNHSITETGWQALSACLQDTNCSLEELHIYSIDISDCGAEALSNTQFHSLKKLDFSDNNNLSTNGWCVFLNNLLQRSNSLETLDISGSSVMDGEGRTLFNQDAIGLALSNALSNNNSLKSFNARRFHSIGPAGWLGLLQCLETNTTLEEINLDYNHIGEDGMIAFIDALSNNTNSGLKKVLFSSYLRSERVHEALLNLVFNKEDVNTILESNHTLQLVCAHREHLLPAHILSMLEINQIDKLSDRVRRKLLHYFEITPELDELVEMDDNVLPYVVAWAAGDSVGVTVLYRLFRQVPSLFGRPRSAAGVKRKR